MTAAPFNLKIKIPVETENDEPVEATPDDTRSKKQAWTPEEDRILTELVKKEGPRNWTAIAEKLQTRVGKQCRERWHNHLAPDVKKQTWSPEEDAIILSSVEKMGPRWCEIVKLLPGRTDNAIKNRYHTHRRKLERNPKREHHHLDPNIPAPAKSQSLACKRLKMEAVSEPLMTLSAAAIAANDITHHKAGPQCSGLEREVAVSNESSDTTVFVPSAEVGDVGVSHSNAASDSETTCKNLEKMEKHPWSAEEDASLRSLVEQYGPKGWTTIATFMPDRVSKQCRERWHNHLSPDVKKHNWSVEEDKIIMESVEKIGKKWSQIVELLPGRTDNAIKNRWNSNMRKMLRQTRKMLISMCPPEGGGALNGRVAESSKSAEVGATGLLSLALVAAQQVDPGDEEVQSSVESVDAQTGTGRSKPAIESIEAQTAPLLLRIGANHDMLYASGKTSSPRARRAALAVYSMKVH